MPAVICKKFELMDDWYTIERAEHANVSGLAFVYSGRISDACVEGSAYEMLAIADAIEARESVSFKRCEAEFNDDEYELSSPRNSTRPGRITLAEADALVLSIRATVVAP